MERDENYSRFYAIFFTQVKVKMWEFVSFSLV